jgi:hypothetical protein
MAASLFEDPEIAREASRVFYVPKQSVEPLICEAHLNKRRVEQRSLREGVSFL